ncbi:MAG: endonuclease III domain-containing protein [bacterium]|nr:endonuclease III domain-containing protein [bacterium]
MTKIYRLYLELLKRYGKPHPWPWKDGTVPSGPFEICVGAILTQNTNWRNVEKALDNLKKANILTVEKLSAIPDGELENYLRPSGFYRQKAERVKNFCRYLLENHDGKLGRLSKQKLVELRKELLALKGVGPETADTILLYAAKKPIFVIDEYTRRLVKYHSLTSDLSYDGLQRFFLNNLPKSVRIYEDYHALIVLDGKNNIHHYRERPKVKRRISSPKS